MKTAINLIKQHEQVHLCFVSSDEVVTMYIDALCALLQNDTHNITTALQKLDGDTFANHFDDYDTEEMSKAYNEQTSEFINLIS